MKEAKKRNPDIKLYVRSPRLTVLHPAPVFSCVGDRGGAPVCAAGAADVGLDSARVGWQWHARAWEHGHSAW